MIYQYGQNFSWRDHRGIFVVHPGEWISVRLPISQYTLSDLPEGFTLDEVEKDNNELIYSFSIEDNINSQTHILEWKSLEKEFCIHLNILPG